MIVAAVVRPRPGMGPEVDGIFGTGFAAGLEKVNLWICSGKRGIAKAGAQPSRVPRQDCSSARMWLKAAIVRAPMGAGEKSE